MSRASIHSYSDCHAFERLMLLVATLVKYPGVGYVDSPDGNSGKHHNASREVLARLRDVAQEVGIDLPLYTEHTIRKDLKVLRRYGILDQSIYRWGYYLGTGAMSREELQVAVNALYSQAKYQQDPQVSKVYQALERRLRGLGLRENIFYPVRTQINRAIIYTDPEEMMSQSKYRGSLFELLEELETAIVKGQVIEIYRCRNPYQNQSEGMHLIRVYPLQLVYSDVAWYLLHEHYQTGHLALSRLDRFSEYFKLIEALGRGKQYQLQSLQIAHQLLETGWGIYLGTRQEQQLERQGQLLFVKVTVRFFREAMAFIQEGEKRHPRQNITLGSKAKDGKPEYLEYSIELPQRSLNEFCYWACRFMGNVRFLTPPYLVEKHRKMAQDLLAQYSSD
ncbi:WYL domain-containing protein [Coleofasciculus sp. FACHB-SPT36]|uniref:helix-turn-helix transcriptional regulator n=1 Tax=Cyanophyceae TaxID=3028117 RepID=UPI00168BDC5E|nr:WYL domain-containing protein [Coleofasciculus sp. FACHB-SPT36]MBD2539808.1 WYL domain-containing protein [Coleofasciculus sp. FACHB-SPT36]